MSKIISFYLPQFHTIPENDYAYGVGFTEWVNTRKAKPLFEEQYQPRTPLNENYYDLLDTKVMVEQARLAKEYGIYGFCYYHYWFGDSKKLLEKPIENMLESKDVDIPFCLCWANENWSKRWDGGNNEIIVEQDYGDEKAWRNHIEYLMDFFLDERYIRVDDMPLLVIYKPELIPNFNNMISYFQKSARSNGLKGIKIAAQYPTIIFMDSEKKDNIDYYIHFEPRYIQEIDRQEKIGCVQKNNEKMRSLIKQWLLKHSFSSLIKLGQKIIGVSNKANFSLEIRDYDKDWEKILEVEQYGASDIPGAFVDWDNTPRNTSGLAYKGANPEKFERYLKKLIDKIDNSKCEKMIFLNAWNEWAEGAYLEPDVKYGYKYLESLKKAINYKTKNETL